MPIKMKIKSHLLAPTQAPVAAQKAVDYEPYMKDLEASIRAAWARPGSKEFMPVGTTFKLLKSGQLKNIEVKLSSGNKKVDRAALRALYLVQAKPLPVGAPEYVNVKFVFESNNGSSCCCGGGACTCANAGACGRSQRF
jgi:TonB family protein